MASENLVELVYLSAATQPFSLTQLRDLLGTSRRNNRAAGVTGLLLHVDGSFLQVLEGPSRIVDELFARISRDPRHGRVLRVFHREVDERSFPAWSMGFSEPLQEMRTEMLGFTRLLDVGETALPDSTAARIRLLVAQFANGRWRQAVDVADAAPAAQYAASPRR